MSELKPCPSGHTKTTRDNNNIYGAWWVKCAECSWRTAGSTEAEAIAAWNTRPQPSAEPVAVWREALRTYNAKTNPHDYSNADTEAARIREADQAAAAVIASALEAARCEALEQAAKAFEAEADTWKAWPEAGAAKRQGAKAIRALKENPNAG